VRGRLPRRARGARRPTVDRVRLTAGLVFACCVFFMPSVISVPAGALLAVATLRWMPLLGSRAEQSHALAQRLSLPIALDVLSLCLDAGVSWDRGVRLAADCCAGGLEQDLRSGGAVSVLLRQYADGERAAERLRRIEASRRLGTTILMPVAFLGYPGFVVLALIPTLVSTAMQLDLGFPSTG